MANTLKAPKILWLTACAFVFIWWIALYGLSDRTPETLKSEAMIYVVIAMTLLSFPIGLIWTIVIAISASLLHRGGVDVQFSVWGSLLFYWASTLVLGYVQWFVVIPRIRARRAERTQQAEP